MFKKTTLTVLCIITVLLSVFAVPASAVTYPIFNVPMTQPNTSVNFGYIEYYVRTASGVEYVEVDVLSVDYTSINYETFQSNICSIYVDIEPHKVEYRPYVVGHSNEYTSVDVYYYTSKPSQGILGSGSELLTVNYSTDTIIGYHVYCNFAYIGSSISSLSPFVVEYGNSDDTADKITQQQQQSTQDIIDNQQSNTQDVIDNQNQIVENEKQESNETGQGSVDSVCDIIPNESEGFINALKKLT